MITRSKHNLSMREALREKTLLTRRQHILDAAIRVFAKSGYHRTTIKEISAASGVSDGTIYNLFENKEELLLSALDPLDESKNSPTPPPATSFADVEQFVRHSFRRRWETFTPETLDVLRVVLSEVLTNPELRDLYVKRAILPAITLPEAYFKKLVSAGKLRPINVSITTRAMVASVLGLVTLRLLGDPYTTKHWNNFPDQLADMLLDGLIKSGEQGKPHDAV